MNSLGTPVPVIDALALDYLGFSFLPVVINNIWTWVAVITAAVSFWRIRAVSLKSDIQDESSPPMVSVSPPPHTEEKEAVMEPASTLASSTTTPSTRVPLAVDVDTTGGPTRGKFTVYYEDESEGEVAWEGGVDDGGVAEVGRGTGGEYWCDNWEKVMRMRIEQDDMGWYRYQDLTVLDGNVDFLQGYQLNNDLLHQEINQNGLVGEN
ncbi:hypothetical protein RHSIM_Rhsim05G0003600 [Rhododendron simsii]|uniref:Uncharacterized protein n=1 Tax=Rhododendron simsii TaxID=118357 RepID=A0A834GZT5_RHOSS|nr:hypothetical protein RHSIM_Rhsim05G0003600 [Rhododendron simsii]